MVFTKDLKNEFQIAMVNEPSVFKPLKVYCSLLRLGSIFSLLTEDYFAHKELAPTGEQTMPFQDGSDIFLLPVYVSFLRPKLLTRRPGY